MSENDWSEEFAYLDKLRDSGDTNMLGAACYLVDEFNIGKGEAVHILKHWMLSKTRQSRDEVTG